jgi:23S rRNA pseudouridine1911/1915/1917 synthase
MPKKTSATKTDELSILWESDFAAVIDKPAGLMTHADGRSNEKTLCDLLVKKWPKIAEVGEPLTLPDGSQVPRPGIVHRLDRDTSGAIVIAKTQQAYRIIKHQFMHRMIKKSYMAFALGAIRNDRFIINRAIGKHPKDMRKWYAGRGAKGDLRDATTLFVVKARVDADTETGKPFTILEAFPKTGRTHQIRVHLRGINHPIACDPVYGDHGGESVAGLKRLGLHALSITLALPTERGADWQETDWVKTDHDEKDELIASIEQVTVKASLPGDLRKALEKNPETKALLAASGGLW